MSSTAGMVGLVYGALSYHTVWDNLPATIRKLDVAAIKSKLDPP